MANASDLIDDAAALIPPWLGWPLSALSTLSAFAGAGLIFAAAAFGSITAGIWSGAAFLTSAVLWHLADFAEGNRPV